VAGFLVIAAMTAAAEEFLSDPTRAFVEGYDPSGNDFLANTPERAVRLRICADSTMTGSRISRCRTLLVERTAHFLGLTLTAAHCGSQNAHAFVMRGHVGREAGRRLWIVTVVKHGTVMRVPDAARDKANTSLDLR
jgi:hypothetical protein